MLGFKRIASRLRQLAPSRHTYSPSAIVYINLDTRPDRRREVEAALGSLPYRVPIHRIAATAHEQNGHIGCGISHIEALEWARAQGLEEVLIVEDDFALATPPSNFARQLSRFMRDEPSRDVASLHATYKNDLIETPMQGLYRFGPEGYATTTLAYLAHRRATAALLETFRDAVARMQAELPASDTLERRIQTEHAIDRAWHPLQRSLHFFLFEPPLARPSGSPSDIMDDVVGVAQERSSGQ